MRKIAVIGAGTLPGRELVKILEVYGCSVLPLSCGQLTMNEELGDLVIFEPQASLLEDIDLVILMEPVTIPGLLTGFSGCILDFCVETTSSAEFIPLVGSWPKGVRYLRARPAIEQVLAIVPMLVESVEEISGTYLQSVACLGDRGIEGLMEQTVAILKGENPELDKLDYRGAFEIIPRAPMGLIMRVMVPSFHGDLLILHIRAADGKYLGRLEETPQGVEWRECPPTSREVAINANLLAHLNIVNVGRAAVLTLGFDPILWGVLRPVLRLLEL